MTNTNYIITSDGGFMSEDELYHYGVLGMKWGVRRHQNKDGTPTSAVIKKRISKKYEKTSKAAMNDLKKQYNRMYVSAYNKAADYMNSGGTDKYNSEQRKKYGENFPDRDGYVTDYNKLVDKLVANNLNKALNEFYKSNKNVAKGRALIDKYNMTSWDDLAKHNSEQIKDVRRAAEDNE